MHTLRRKRPDLRTSLHIISALVLLIGSVSAVLIYHAAVNEPADDSGYEVIGGFIYPGGGASNKRYVHDLQLYGGKSAVLADDFMRWFSGLWHGTNLAYTVGFITLVVSFMIFVISNNVHVAAKPDDGNERTAR
jgi:multisubunit Na+/H+ antiporter MnhG subunit